MGVHGETPGLSKTINMYAEISIYSCGPEADTTAHFDSCCQGFIRNIVTLDQ